MKIILLSLTLFLIVFVSGCSSTTYNNIIKYSVGDKVAIVDGGLHYMNTGLIVIGRNADAIDTFVTSLIILDDATDDNLYKKRLHEEGPLMMGLIDEGAVDILNPDDQKLYSSDTSIVSVDDRSLGDDRRLYYQIQMSGYTTGSMWISHKNLKKL